MENQNCSSCGAKSRYPCGFCEGRVCKSCVQFVDEDRFSFQPELAEKFTHSTYCPQCYDQHIAPAAAKYDDTMEKAKDILVYEKSQGKETRLLSRTAKPVRVESCADRDETLLRLAFQAALAGYNGIIDVDIKHEKVRDGAYQTTNWSGTGIPTNIEGRRLVRDRSTWDNPN
jgi:hypothetical protein